MRLNQIIIAAATLATLASGCGTPQTGGTTTKVECKSDRDCKNGQICTPDKDIAGMNTCMDEPSGYCASDRDCKNGDTCDTGVHQCKSGNNGPQCRINSDCSSGQVCDGGSCKDPRGNPDSPVCRADEIKVHVASPSGKHFEPRVFFAQDTNGADGNEFHNHPELTTCLTKAQVCKNTILVGYTQGMTDAQIQALPKKAGLEFAGREWNIAGNYATDKWLGCNSAETVDSLIVEINDRRVTGTVTRLPQACGGGGQGNLVVRWDQITGLSCN